MSAHKDLLYSFQLLPSIPQCECTINFLNISLLMEFKLIQIFAISINKYLHKYILRHIYEYFYGSHYTIYYTP